VASERVEEHAIHREAYCVAPETLRALDAARADGRRLIAVGTTAVRVLETLYRTAEPGGPAAGATQGWADLFITPGYRFRAVDALITNFHLPRTTLLALVMAFAGVEPIRRAYTEAVARRYRFYSFGDAMLIADGLRPPAGAPTAPEPR
jgi:S-adenosylmethionine:tRNA ribosyltransferase-isomerase